MREGMPEQSVFPWLESVGVDLPPGFLILLPFWTLLGPFSHLYPGSRPPEHSLAQSICPCSLFPFFTPAQHGTH